MKLTSGEIDRLISWGRAAYLDMNQDWTLRDDHLLDKLRKGRFERASPVQRAR